VPVHVAQLPLHWLTFAAQSPSVPHVAQGPEHIVLSNVHVPSVCPLQREQLPLQALSQQYPSTQKPETHCVPSVPHGWPFLSKHSPTLLHAPVHPDGGIALSLLLTGQEVGGLG
jgi:hypothetical protein